LGNLPFFLLLPLPLISSVLLTASETQETLRTAKTRLLSLLIAKTTTTMHSKLDLHKHVSCEDIIIELDKCHKSGFLNRYLGGCNHLKQAMNDCLQAEVTLTNLLVVVVQRDLLRFGARID
jgi:hypothetical protein